jgi:hypothetical protein
VPNARPVLTLDFDGVICRPPLGINPGRGKNKRRDGEGRQNLLWWTERWRYLGRKPMRGVQEGFLRLSETYDCKVLSARSLDAHDLTLRWCERYIGVRPELHLRPDWHETPAQFKVRMVTTLRPVAHFEDDPHTAQWISELLPAVFLVDWWRNRWLDAPNIYRIHDLVDAVPVLTALTSGS